MQHFQNRPIFDFKNWQSAGNSFLVLNMFFISSYRLSKVSKLRVCFSILCKIGAKSDEIKRISKKLVSVDVKTGFLAVSVIYLKFEALFVVCSRFYRKIV